MLGTSASRVGVQVMCFSMSPSLLLSLYVFLPLLISLCLDSQIMPFYKRFEKRKVLRLQNIRTLGLRLLQSQGRADNS